MCEHNAELCCSVSLIRIVISNNNNNNNNRVFLMAVPSDRNTSMKVTEKLSKYKDLEIETNGMWGMRTETIPELSSEHLELSKND